MDKISQRAGHIVLIILTLVFVFLLTSLRSYILAPFSNKPSKYLQLDESSLEAEIFQEINDRRMALGNNPLEWDERIYHTAKAHSLDLLTHKIFSHQDLTGEGLVERLENEDLFFLMAAENICRLAAGTNHIPYAVVEGWMKSPSHRWLIIDRDQIFTHGAVGVECNKLSCYVTFDCADFVADTSATLKPHSYIRINLNDESLGFRGSYPVNIEVRSSIPVDIYFFDTFAQLNNFVETGSDSSNSKAMQTVTFSDQREARKDSYILIQNRDDSPADISCGIVYN